MIYVLVMSVAWVSSLLFRSQLLGVKLRALFNFVSGSCIKELDSLSREVIMSKLHHSWCPRDWNATATLSQLLKCHRQLWILILNLINNGPLFSNMNCWTWKCGVASSIIRPLNLCLHQVDAVTIRFECCKLTKHRISGKLTKSEHAIMKYKHLNPHLPCI